MGLLESVQSADAPLVGTNNAPRPLVVFLHGYGSHEHDLAGLAPYLPTGMPWVSVRAPQRHPFTGYAWYPLEGDDFAPVEPVEHATKILWEWVDAHVDAHAPLIPVGFSQGGFMASQLLRTRPERVPAAALLAGYVHDHPQAGDDTLVQTRPRVFWGKGTQDFVVPERAIAHASAWLPQHTTLSFHEYPGMGHSVNEEELHQLRQFLTEVTPANG